MAHEIDKFGEVRKGEAFAGVARGRAWHRLGKELREGLTVREGFDELGMGWSTELCPLTTTFNGKQITIPDFRAHVRCDTKDTLGIVGKDYRPISNQQMAEFADALVGADKAVTLETGGSLRGGRRVFALIKLPKDTVVLGDDHLKNYVCISNGHDGLNAFRTFFTPIRVVCANTLAMAEASVSGARFNHDGDVTKKIELARATLGILVKRSESFAEQAQALARVSLTEAKVSAYFDDVYGKTFGATAQEEITEGATTEGAKDDKSKKHYEKVIGAWKANMVEASNFVKATEGTAWQALNAVTFYHDHQRGRMKSVEESDSRVHSNLFGASAKDKAIALRTALSLIPA